MVEADPDVAAAMDILSFALYHENNNVIEENNETAASQKRQREEVTDSSDAEGQEEDEEEQNAKRQREDKLAALSAPSQAAVDPLMELKQAIYTEVTKSLDDSIAVDDVCTDVNDRALVSRAIESLEADGKIMTSEGEIYLVD